MCDALSALLQAVDSVPAPILMHDDLAHAPSHLLAALQDSRVLQRAHPAEQVACLECGEYEDVAWLATENAAPIAYARCGLIGPYRISPERLEQWTVSIPELLTFLAGAIPIRGRRSELVRDHVWLLGKTGVAGASRNVYFVRGLHRPGGAAALRRIRLSPHSLVFVPSRLPDRSVFASSGQVVVSLAMAVAWNEDELLFDREYIVGRLERNRAGNGGIRKRKPVPRRAPRAATIEALKQELVEHLRAARDHARDTLDRTGTPELLPRPTMEFLARKLGIHKSSVSRALSDQSAEELKFLWDLAADLDRILSHSCVGQ